MSAQPFFNHPKHIHCLLIVKGENHRSENENGICGKEADVKRLSSHLDMLYFHWCSFMQGHRSTTPKWCVCSGPTRVWVTGWAHPHQHDTAQKNRLARLPAETGCADSVARLSHSPSVYFTLVWATRGPCEEERENKNVSTTCPVCSHACIAAFGYYLQEYFCFASPHLPRLFGRWKD